MIFERVKNEEWSGREDLNLRPLGYENGRLPLSAVESIAPKAQLSCQNRFYQSKVLAIVGRKNSESLTAYPQAVLGSI